VILTATSVDKFETVRGSSPFGLDNMVWVLVTLPLYVSHHSTLKEVFAENPVMVTVPLIGAMVPLLVQT
jgi:hypothetical protein